MSSNPFQMLKGVQTLTFKEQIAVDTMKALKESKQNQQETARYWRLKVPDEEKVTSEANVIVEWGSEQENDEETDDEFLHGEEHVQDDDEETNDEFVHGDEQVNDDEDEEMTNAEVEESGNGNEEITDAAKVDAGKTEEVKDDAKKAELPPTSSSLSVSLGFGDQFPKLSSDTSLIGTIKDTTDAEINSLLDIKIQYEVPHIQSPPVLIVPVLVISEPSILTPIPKTPLVASATTLQPPSSVSTIPHVLLQTTTPIPSPPITTEAPTVTTVVPKFDAPTVIQLRVAKLEKDVDDHQKVLQRHTADLIQKYSVRLAPELSKIQTLTINLEPESEKIASEIRKIKKEQAKKQKMLKYTIKSTDKAALKEYDQKSALYQTMNENKTFNRNPANHTLYHALMEALIVDENAMDKGVTDKVKNHKRQHDDAKVQA
ncbi:hypothetical protein Tco_0420436 [Tanacetum coccineum]